MVLKFLIKGLKLPFFKPPQRNLGAPLLVVIDFFIYFIG